MLLAEHPTTFCDEQFSCACQAFNSVNYMLSLFITTAKESCMPSFALVLDLDRSF